MSHEIRTQPFDHATGVPCAFVLDLDSELLRLEPAESVYLQRDETLDIDSIDAAAIACSAWGQHACASPAQANRYIESTFPNEWAMGTKFNVCDDDE